MRFFLSLFFLSLFSIIHAETVGSIELIKGNVKVKSEDSIKKKKVFAGLEIESGDLVSSSKDSTAKIKLNDGSILILDEESTVLFASATEAEQTQGKILYKITSRDASNALKITTPFAIIGVKGTTFIVNATENASVSLKEGVIGIESINEQFNLYKQRVEQEFDDYIQKQDEEFQKFKDAQNKYEDPQLTNSFDLESGHRISFSGKRVNQDKFTDNDDAEFENFNKLEEDMNQ